MEEQGITFLPQLSEEDMKVLCPKIGDRITTVELLKVSYLDFYCKSVMVITRAIILISVYYYYYYYMNESNNKVIVFFVI